MYLLTLLACGAVCGPGTKEVDGICVAAANDTAAESDADTDSDSDTDTDTDTDADADTDTDTDTDTTGDGFFAPFVDASAYPTPKLGDIAAETGLVRYALGFIVDQTGSSCTGSWGTYYTVEAGPSSWDGGGEYFLYTHLDTVKSMGGELMVSFGGAANTPLASACSSTSALAAEYLRIVDALDITHIDFDVEGYWVADATSINRRNEAVAELQAELASQSRSLQVWYTLPVLPSGLTNDGVALLEDAVAKGVRIDGVNVMTMDYGDSAAPNPDGQMGEYGIDAVTALHAQLDTLYTSAGSPKSDEVLWSMIGSTPMIGLNDVTTETFYLQDADETVAFAREKGMGLLSMWSLNRDHPCPDQSWVSIDCSSTPDQSVDYEFVSAFQAFDE